VDHDKLSHCTIYRFINNGVTASLMALATTIAGHIFS